MARKPWFLFFLSMLLGVAANAQKIVYSEVDKEDSRRLNFEVIGKINGNFLIYKSIRNSNWISILDNDMKQVAKIDQGFLPDNDRVINVDFIAYPDFAYMIFQYRRKNVIHVSAAKINGEGKLMGELKELDTTQVNFGADNKIYSVIASEDKGRIMVFKINSKNKRNYLVTTVLFDNQLNLLRKSRMGMPMEDRDDFLDEFTLDNDGDMVFSKFDRVNNENIGTSAFVVKYADVDSFSSYELKPGNRVYFDEIHIKPDNFNKRYFLTSFYYNQRRGNVDGYYFYIWDKVTRQVVREDTLAFSDELRREARGNASTKTAFNDYFIRNIITRRDGGFLIASEAFYTSSRGGAWNRYNYMYGSPFMRSYDYYSYSPYYNGLYGMGNRWNDFQNVRYQADNIVISSYDKNGVREWNSVIAKQQFDDQNEDLISYQLFNSGGQLHFLFNNMEKRLQLLNDFSIDPKGKIDRNPTLKNLDRGYDFMPKYAKQVSARQMIIPCVYRNYICFAKLEYN
ncbi:MAG: hypothetical protein EOO09_03915 [Chitinophagaceae bacterium]|nr:MAG: hypothetical protein EOO09_03915 [Chitinophagaceae bacterium]